MTKTEPLRARLYPFVVAVVGVLLAYSYVSQDQAAAWIALAAAVTGGTAVEKARAKVTPAGT